MRSILFVILFVSLLACNNTLPIESVRNHNLALAKELDGSVDPGNIQTGFIDYSFDNTTYGSLQVNASAGIAGLSLSIDNSTRYDRVEVIIERGHEMESLGTIPGADERTFYDLRGKHCNRPDIPNPPFVIMCDFDNDFCGELEHRQMADYDLNITFEYDGHSAIIPVEGNVIRVPPSLEETMENASGLKNLSINLGGKIRLWYVLNDRRPYRFGLGCGDGLVNTSKLVFHINDTREYRVEGGDKLFFLEAPVLREQWFRSNKFEMGVFSQSRLYEAEISLNKERICHFNDVDFELFTNRRGIQSIRTTGKHPIANYTATPLSRNNNTLGYYYLFSCRYEGLGKNNLSIDICDYYGYGASSNESILSRRLSYGNKTDELGMPVKPSITRPSAVVGKDSLGLITISAGMLGMLIILLLANRWFLFDRKG